VYSDGDALFVHADRRTQSDGVIRAPGMWRLTRRCQTGGKLSAEGLQIVSKGAGEQEVCLLASVPLTSEGWVPLVEGEILVAQQGCTRVSDVRQHVP
jgi:glutamine amidotransferase